MSRADVVSGLDAEIAAAKLHSPILVCHSAACMLMPDLARLGGGYSALCALSGPILAPGEIGSAIFGQGIHGSEPDRVGYPVDPRTSTPEQLRRAMFCLDMTPADAAQFLANYGRDIVPRRMLSDPAQAFDSQALPPLTYVLTRRNPVFPVAWQRRWAARLGQKARIVEIDTPHMPFFTHPAVLASKLVELYG